MTLRKLSECAEIMAGDGSTLREIFNPHKEKDLPFRYSLAHAIVAPGETTFPHSLKTSEVYYILSGSGKMYVGEKMREVEEGDTVSIPPNAVQKIENTGKGNLVFLCIVDPAWRPEDENILNS